MLVLGTWPGRTTATGMRSKMLELAECPRRVPCTDFIIWSFSNPVSLFYRKGKWGSEKVSDLPQVTQQGGCGTRIHSQDHLSCHLYQSCPGPAWLSWNPPSLFSSVPPGRSWAAWNRFISSTLKTWPSSLNLRVPHQNDFASRPG